MQQLDGSEQREALEFPRVQECGGHVSGLRIPGGDACHRHVKSRGPVLHVQRMLVPLGPCPAGNEIGEERLLHVQRLPGPRRGISIHLRRGEREAEGGPSADVRRHFRAEGIAIECGCSRAQPDGPVVARRQRGGNLLLHVRGLDGERLRDAENRHA